MEIKTKVLVSAVALAMAGAASHAIAAGGPSGPNVTYAVQGNIGEVIVNPYKNAPLTAVIRTGGYQVKNAKVEIVPKMNGRKITYAVADDRIRTHGGIPVFGLYPDYLNTVKVEYDRVYNGRTEHFADTYQFYAPPLYGLSTGAPNQTQAFFKTDVVHVDPAFEDRLYLVNTELMPMPSQGARMVWNNPMGGALEWSFTSTVSVVDTAGDIRWYLMTSELSDTTDPWTSGDMMGFQQTADGALTWGFGQNYVKYDLMGREIFNRRLPASYNDFSHSMDNMQNGHYLLRVASNDVRRADGKRVRTVRDVIVEVDRDGNVTDEWRLFDILDPYRSEVIKAMDQGTVCLNVDASKAGQTLSAEDLAKMDDGANFGDIAGTGLGRNWAHVNSVDYDPSDDSIIISARHQAIIKIGRDKKVKWILGAPAGWKKGFAEKVLKPMENGKPANCGDRACEGEFDWSWTQHTAFRIDEKSDSRYLYLSVFDNGDSRGMEQPALAEMKYSRGVVYKIDQKKMTVEQVWAVGKNEGFDHFSPITGLCQYQADRDTMVVYFSTAGLGARPGSGKLGRMHPYIKEYRWGETKPVVELKMWDVSGYQAFPIDVKKAFSNPLR